MNAQLFFDTSAANPGFFGFEDMGTAADGGTGFSGFSAAGDALNGGTMVILSYTNFGPGETHTHVGDVDDLLVPPDCSHIPVDQQPICAGLLATTLLSASRVDGTEFASSTVDITLDGPGVANPVVLSAAFVNGGGNHASATWTGVVEVDGAVVTPVPEPSTYALLGSGLAGLIGFARRRNR